MAYEYFNKWAPWMMSHLQADFKISKESAAAIIGNAGHESGGFKSLQEIKPTVEGSRGGYGVMQWTGPRRRDFEAYCKRNGLNPKAMETNYAFLFVELKGAEGKSGRVIERVEAAKGLEAKTEVFMKEFLRPGIPHLSSRVVWANRALQAAEGYVPLPQPPKHGEGPVAPLPAPKKSLLVLIIEFLLKLFRK